MDDDDDEIMLGSPHPQEQLLLDLENEQGVPAFESDNEGFGLHFIAKKLRDEDNAFLARTAEQTGRHEDMFNIVSTMLR